MFRTAFVAAALLLLHIRAFGQDGDAWRATVARVDITPDEPVFMAGYASRDRPFDGVEARLFAKALALTDSKGMRAVLITTDLIGLDKAMSTAICRRIGDEAGLDRSQILINSSHTHTGPVVTLDPVPGDQRSSEETKRQIAYTRELQDKIVGVALAALNAEPQAVELSWGTGLIHFVMNRRQFTEERGVILGVNPRGPVDRSVPVLKVASRSDDGDEKLLAVVFQAACHNTTLGGNYYRITGDYAGYAQAHVEQAYPGAQAMFMIGCGGDANPHPRDNSVETSQKHGAELGEAVGAVLEDAAGLRPIEGPLRTTFAEVELPLQALPSKAELTRQRLQPGGWRGWVADRMSTYHEPGAEPFPETFPAPFSVWQFGDDLTLVALSGEVVVDYVQILERALGPLNLWLSAYCHEVYGYLPSARVLREGGYETRGLYHGVGFFQPEVEKRVAKTLRRLADEAGRALPED